MYVKSYLKTRLRTSNGFFISSPIPPKEADSYKISEQKEDLMKCKFKK